MSDLGPLPDDVRDFLDAERDLEHPERATRDRMFARLVPFILPTGGGDGGGGTAGPAAAGSAATSAAVKAVWRGKVMLSLVSAAIGAAIGAVIGVFVHLDKTCHTPEEMPSDLCSRAEAVGGGALAISLLSFGSQFLFPAEHYDIPKWKRLSSLFINPWP